MMKAARDDLLSFAMMVDPEYEPNWHHELIAEKLMDIHNGKLKRLIIQMPPRHGKSRLTSEIFPAWTLGKRASQEVMVGSYSESLAKEFGSKSNALVREDMFNLLFGLKLRRDKKGAGAWSLTGQAGGKGGFRAVGLQGAITGRGANIFIVDDPIRNRQDADSKQIRDTIWKNFSSAVRTRLRPQDSIVIVETTWHLDDIIGRETERLKEEDRKLEDEWCVLRLPALATEREEWIIQGETIVREKGEALWPSHFNKEQIEKIRSEIGIIEFSSLYQQNPITSETQIFKQDYFKYRDESDLEGKDCMRYLTVDPSIGSGDKSDYTGFCDNRVDRESFWHFMGWHKRLSPKELIDTLFALHKMHAYDMIGIEKTVLQMAIKPFLQDEMIRRNSFLPIMELEHLQRSKISRVGDLESRYEAGKVFHMKGWHEDMENELLTYPKGLHDDIIDACAYQIQITESYQTEDEFEDQDLFDKNGFY